MTLNILIFATIYLVGAFITYKYFTGKIIFAALWPIELAIFIVLFIGGVIWSLSLIVLGNIKEWFYKKSTRQ